MTDTNLLSLLFMTTRTINWTGKSGKNYSYNIYQIGTEFNEVPANYVFMQETKPGYFKPIYFGITNNLANRFDNHEKMPCIKKNQATHIGVHQNKNESDRKSQESDLLANYNTACNILEN